MKADLHKQNRYVTSKNILCEKYFPTVNNKTKLYRQSINASTFPCCQKQKHRFVNKKSDGNKQEEIFVFQSYYVRHIAYFYSGGIFFHLKKCIFIDSFIPPLFLLIKFFVKSRSGVFETTFLFVSSKETLLINY